MLQFWQFHGLSYTETLPDFSFELILQHHLELNLLDLPHYYSDVPTYPNELIGILL